MNERILELAEQARKYADDNEEHWKSGSGRDWDSLFEQKFGELIVRECINIACEYDKPKLSGPGHAIASYIESHFDIYIGEDGRFVK